MTARRGTLALYALLATAPLGAQAGPAARPDYAAAAAAVERLVAHEIATKRIPAMSVALVDDRKVVWAAGFGWADPRRRIPATASTVYRAGSVTKLVTSLAVLRLVEDEALDLDAPITDYLPDFTPPHADTTAITLRLLLAHFAGLVREPAAGGYFDTSAPTLAATVATLVGTPLVYPPGVRFKYSNAGFAVIGAVLERVTGEPFADYMRRKVLRPLGAQHSDFARTPAVASRLAVGEIWTLDGRRWPAPAFEFGMAPAIGLYASVEDMARVVHALLEPGERDSAAGGPEQLLGRAMLERMWSPQLTSPRARGGMGLGVFVGSLDGMRRVGHDGAVYGYAMQVSVLPDERLGLVVATSLEGSSAAIERVAVFALRAALAARAGRTLPDPPLTDALPPGRAAQLAGVYRAGAREIELRRRGDTLAYLAPPGYTPLALRTRGDTLVVDDARDGGLRLLPLEDALVSGGDTLYRIPAQRPGPAPERLLPFLGEYGWDHNVLHVYEEHGRLFALLQWFYTYPLTPVNDTTFAFPPTGLYPGERVIFRRASDGRMGAAVAGNVTFPRRPLGPADGGQLRLRPQAPVAALLRAARRAASPVDSAATRAPDLLDLARLDASLRFDVRYATTNNFLSSVFYPRAAAYLQRPAAEALVRVHRRLTAQGFGLLIHDAYRPWYVTKVFWDATPLASRWLVADPARGSRHNRGCAVDLTLYDLRTGRPVDMVATYDEATVRSRPDYVGGTALQRWHRELLRTAMEAEGFVINADEWWHFDYPEWPLYPIMNQSFDELDRRPT